ncbi:MAG TPA: PH domain-containing protein, partial [Xanthomonadaceae bacterium]|nr:PH domain-containing protein [Xanthomonadaceae bacterium]
TLLAYLRQFVVPLIVLLVLGGGAWWQWVGLIAAPLLVVASVVYALTFRYWLEGDALVLRSGLLMRQRRVLQLRRIQNIGRRQNLLHRVFGVTELQVESAGGVTSEAHMRVLTLAEADRLERLLREAAALDAGPDDVDAAPLLQVPGADLVRLGLISNRGMVVVGAAFALLAQAGDSLERVAQPLASAVERLLGEFIARHSLDSTAAVLGIVLLVLLALALVRLLSVAIAVLVFHDFRLCERHGRFTADYGLLTRVRTSATRIKIQKLWIDESLLHRMFGRVSIRLDVAGTEMANEGEGRRMRWLAPVCTAQQARTLVEAVLPGVDIDALDWCPVHPSARRRRFRRAALALTLPVLVAAWLHSPWMLLILCALPLLWLSARGWALYSGHALEAQVFAVRQGWLGRQVVLARRDRAQVLLLARSPFDRRHGTATLEMDVAGGGQSARLRLPFVDFGIAQALFAQLSSLSLAAVPVASDPSFPAHETEVPIP